MIISIYYIRNIYIYIYIYLHFEVELWNFTSRNPPRGEALPEMVDPVEPEIPTGGSCSLL